MKSFQKIIYLFATFLVLFPSLVSFTLPLSVFAEAIPNISVSPASTALGMTTSYTITYTAPSALGADGGYISLNFMGDGDPEQGYLINVSSATLSLGTNILGTIEHPSGMGNNSVGIILGSQIAVGSSVQIVLGNVVNAGQPSFYRCEVRTMFRGQEVDRGISSNFVLGNLSLVGRVFDPSGNPVSRVGVSLHTEDFSFEQGSGTNDEGIFSFFDIVAGSYVFEVHLSPDSQFISPPAQNVAISTNITTNLGDINLISPTKRVSGYVRYENGNPVTNAEVSANKKGERRWQNARVGSDGGFTLGLTGGDWELFVNPPWDPNTNRQVSVDWAYMGRPQAVSFAENGVAETATVNFSVVSATATVKGKVVYPDGNPARNGGVDLRSEEGRGTGGGFGNDGIFSLRVPAGTYKLGVFMEDQSYAAPSMDPFTIGDSEIKDLGTITLVLKNEHIKGTVSGSGPIAGVRINAWQKDGGWGQTTTGVDGTYDLLVTPGIWEVMPEPAPSLNYVYEAGPPKRVSVGEDQTVSGVNFILTATDATISGKVVDSYGSVLSQFFGFAMAMRGSGNATGPGPGTEIRNGIFTLKVPHGTWTVNADTEPGSNYSSTDGQTVTLVAAETKSVTITMKENDAVISGTVKNESGAPITGIYAEVFADSPSGSFKHVFVDSLTGTYRMGVISGTFWHMGVHVEADSGYVMLPPDDNKVIVSAAGQTVTRDFTLLTADATISGKVYDPNGNALANVFVFADSNAVEGGEVLGASTVRAGGTQDSPVGGVAKGSGVGVHTGGLSGSDGSFSIAVPAGKYGIGSGAPPSLGYINPALQEVAVASGGRVTGITLRYRAADGAISGSVYLSGTKHQAFIWAWSETGGFSETMTSSGDYALNITKNDIWHIGAVYEAERNFYLSPEYIVSVGNSGLATQDLTMSESSFTLPPAVSRTFDASMPATLMLEDGMTIEIPAGALATEGYVVVIVTPTAELAKQQQSQPLAFGYEITAMQNGQEINSTFNSDVTISIPYTNEMLSLLGITESDIAAAYFSDDSSLWSNITSTLIDRDSNKVVLTVNHFTTFSLVTSATDTTPPSVPTNITVSNPGTGGTLNLSWTNPSNTDFDYINIYRSITSGTLGTKIHSTTSSLTTSYSNSSLTNGTVYYYTLRSVDTSGNESVNTDQHTGTPTAPAELPATGVLLTEALAFYLERLLILLGAFIPLRRFFFS